MSASRNKRKFIRDFPGDRREIAAKKLEQIRGKKKRHAIYLAASIARVISSTPVARTASTRVSQEEEEEEEAATLLFYVAAVSPRAAEPLKNSIVANEKKQRERERERERERYATSFSSSSSSSSLSSSA